MNFSEIKNKKGFNIAVKIAAAFVGLVLCVLTVFLTERGLSDTKKAESVAVGSDISEVGGSSSEQPSSSQVPEPEPAPASLIMHNPSSRDITVTAENFTFKGSCPEGGELTLSGEKIELDAGGNFSKDVTLKIGENRFSCQYNGQKYDYVIRYRYIVIKSYSPSAAMSLTSGTSFNVSVTARIGSESVSASFYGSQINLTREANADLSNPEGFCSYFGSFALPEEGISNKNLGKVKFSATFRGISEGFSSGTINCRDPLVAEIVVDSAETFNGNTKDNMTRPTNNYLPKGTVDYVNGSFSMTDGGYKNNFLILGCGRRIYSDMPVTPGKTRITVAKTYVKKLPDHNELSVASVNADKNRTYITLNTMWKAPFFFDLKPQAYTNPSVQNYAVSAFTATYAEISFCYSTALSGTLDFSSNPLFSSAEIFSEGGNYKLRLHFRKAGGFYGWDCYYNSAGQLVFEFLHSKKATATDANPYGADLSGIKVLVDAGHGGFDPGALGIGGAKESERNLSLAFKIKAELEKCGAQVVMSRTSDVALRSDNRVAFFRNTKPDFCVSIHHDSSTSSKVNGFGSYYSSPFSVAAAHTIYEETIKTGIYSGGNRNKIGWHHFYMARMQFCPSILTENGYMKGSIDGGNIINDAVNQQKAEAITRGIARYFLSQS